MRVWQPTYAYIDLYVYNYIYIHVRGLPTPHTHVCIYACMCRMQQYTYKHVCYTTHVCHLHHTCMLLLRSSHAIYLSARVLNWSLSNHLSAALLGKGTVSTTTLRVLFWRSVTQWLHRCSSVSQASLQLRIKQPGSGVSAAHLHRSNTDVGFQSIQLQHFSQYRCSISVKVHHSSAVASKQYSFSNQGASQQCSCSTCVKA